MRCRSKFELITAKSIGVCRNALRKLWPSGCNSRYALVIFKANGGIGSVLIDEFDRKYLAAIEFFAFDEQFFKDDGELVAFF